MAVARFFILLLCLAPALTLAVEKFTYRVVDKLPQSRDNFVQGLQIIDDHLYVSTGNFGKSHLLRYQFPEGTLLTSRKLHPRIFAEGLTVLGDRVYQLTWRNRAMLVYEREQLELLHSFPIPGEGWGMTSDGQQLIYSDGSDKLHFLSPQSGRIEHSISVREEGRPLHRLNELEWVEGALWANVWQSNRVVIINPRSGEVTGSIDLNGLLPGNERRSGTDVLNGIARNPADGGIWVTGKRWPWLYRIEVLPKGADLP
jgi:glutamine cyclotransferase